MSLIDWAAIVGAAAWLPQIGSAIYKWIARPILKLIPGPQPEVGYTSLGPILNILCAISASRKDAVIERIEADVVHERGQTNKFVWTTLNETFSQLRSPEGITDVVRNQPAIALKVSTLVLGEKLIGFDDPEFKDRGRVLINAVAERRSYLEKTEANPDVSTARSKEFADLVDHYRRSFPWQAGKYTANIRMFMADVKNPATESLTFELNVNDVDRLKRNLDEVERYLREIVSPPQDRVDYHWQWLNPALKRVTKK